MSTCTTVSFDEKQYTWDGDHWYRDADFMRPPQAIERRLNELISGQVAADDAEVTDLRELVRRAQRARLLDHLDRALELARRAHNLNRGHIGAATVLCSILRELNHPAEAILVANSYRNSSYAPILTSRAAALCDLGRWEEGLCQIRQVLAISMRRKDSGSSEALAVHARIRSNAPELFR